MANYGWLWVPWAGRPHVLDYRQIINPYVKRLAWNQRKSSVFARKLILVHFGRCISLSSRRSTQCFFNLEFIYLLDFFLFLRDGLVPPGWGLGDHFGYVALTSPECGLLPSPPTSSSSACGLPQSEVFYFNLKPLPFLFYSFSSSFMSFWYCS